MRVVKESLLTRIEGSASINLQIEGGKVIDAKVCVHDYRGIEKVLIGRPYMDALVINPRVCGICGHAHLRATVEAIEDALKVKHTKKAKIIRDITNISEILQNHVKWFYLYLMPDFVTKKKELSPFYEPFKGVKWRKAIEFSNLFVTMNALFSGQWPHSSYMVPGGVTCHVDEHTLIRAAEILNKAKSYICILDEDIENFKDLCFEFGLENIGNSYTHFLANCKVCYEEKQDTVKPDLIEERDDYSFQSKNPLAYSWALTVRYMGLPYQVGPIARAVKQKDRKVMSLFKVYKDSFMVRVLARLYEIHSLIEKLDQLLIQLEIHLNKPSWLRGKVKDLSGVGYALVEAARGTLLHKVWIKKGTIRDYKIITPSAWNLGPRCKNYIGVAEKAMLSAKDEWSAQLILRSFDVCSVCTTH